jgi:hypothetical protein
VVVDITAEYLTDIYRGRTTIQADALAAMYLGKWIIVTGNVANVWKSTRDYRMIIRADGDYEKLVTLDFGENEHIAYFARDSEITAHGKIERVSSSGFGLSAGESHLEFFGRLGRVLQF